MKRIFAINLGSTSTKVAYYEDEREIFRDSITHAPEDLEPFQTVFDQKDYRKNVILEYMREHDIDPATLDAFVTRGGQTEPVSGGVYELNEDYVRQAFSGLYGTHVCSVGSAIALEITNGLRALPLTVDTPCTDELQPLARYTGLKEITRQSSFQALNHRAMAKHFAKTQGLDYKDMNLVVVMLGGGITVVAHRHGKMVDAPDGLEGDGPFSNNRCCSVPVGPLVRLCYSGRYDFKEMMKHINGEAGLMSYLGTTDIRAILKQIEDGDTYAKEVVDAMCYQTAKEVGAMAVVLRGDVDAVLLIGGMANAEYICDRIREQTAWIAPVHVLPGEREMESLCLTSLDALSGKEPIQQFVPTK